MSFDTPLPPYNANDPYATFLNASCLDLLLIEMVPTAFRITDELLQRDQSNGVQKTKTGVGGGGGGGVLDGGGGTSTGTGTGTGMDGEDGEEGERRREGAHRRLEAVGYRVGQGIVER